MNSKYLARLLAVSLMLTMGATGCKKKLQNVTPLPGTQPGAVADAQPRGPVDTSPANPVPPDTGPGAISSTTTPTTTPTVPETGLEPTNKDFTKWIEDRMAFQNQTVFFDFDKDTVKSSETSKLDDVAGQMKSKYTGKALRVEGHCDERGTEEYNRALGERRALAIREYLTRAGVDPSMIDTITFGEDRPADPAHDETAWKKNRRGELILLTRPTASAGGTP